jgi:predicted DNA-binding protein (MmcQ/YjbR family)
VDLESFRTRCLAKPGTTEDVPFGPDVLVFRVAGKMFALVNLERLPMAATLKCDPDRALVLRDRYAGVEPGYHMSKKHWNTVALRGDVPPGVLRGLVDDAYALVVAGLPRGKRNALGTPDGSV